MALQRAPLLFLGAVLGAFVPGTCCGSLSHSLCYSYLHLSEPSQGPPQSFIGGYLDDQPISRFDSHTRKMEPLVSWVKEVEEGTFLPFESVFRADLEKLSKLGHRAGGEQRQHHLWPPMDSGAVMKLCAGLSCKVRGCAGAHLRGNSAWRGGGLRRGLLSPSHPPLSWTLPGLHTLQAILGCEIKKDGNKGGFLRYGYNRWDIISFQNETLRLGAAQPQAEKVKEDDDPEWSEKVNVFLEKTCIVWLQRYLSYRKDALKRAEPPVGKVTRKEVDDSLEILICQASGFYLKEIQATWMRDKEVWNNETLHRNVAPNSDGTYYVRLSTKINPKERQRFRCRLEHEGLQEPLVLAWQDKTATMWWIPVAIVAAINVGLWILFLRAQGILWQLEVPEGSGSRSANMTQARKESAVAQKVELLSRAVGDV
ncbi:major histocompatibility complex class I-related gene protein-like [Thamnophis elegans]|uniref:major histocompatibility complex class I-related gene protein-like n=1 Tax=Thamnophis elegans TaxID=35005 RepID=UPI001376A6FF|nr:major histocompatibility complex class I-related gene protein-like [Thamnophis elegans]